ncbi:MAG: hypothetical protein KDB07_01390, partial [Planctomycetes bacterium]|nr:hypothetical protein [Planctomycetota bacterium]
VTNPERVAEPELAALTAFWYWNEHAAEDTKRTCSEIAQDADLTMKQRCYGVSGVINWGMETPPRDPNHMEQRLLYTKKAAQALGVAWTE